MSCTSSHFLVIYTRSDESLNSTAAGPASQVPDSSSRPTLPARPGSGASPSRTSASLPDQGPSKKRPHTDIESSEKRGRPPPVLSAASSANDTTHHAPTPSRSATPAGSVSAQSHQGSANATSSSRDPVSASAQKRSEKRSKSVGRSSSRAKGSTSGGEQDDKPRASAKAGGSHSSKDKGKATVYHPRVDPAVLQLVKYVAQV